MNKTVKNSLKSQDSSLKYMEVKCRYIVYIYYLIYNMAILENIEVWKKSVQLWKDIYALCKNNSQIKNDYGIRDQIQRSAVSIASNIAEWNDRETDKDYVRFLYIARGSCSELKTQIYIIEEYLDPKELEDTITKIIEIHKMLNSLIKKIKNNIEKNYAWSF